MEMRRFFFFFFGTACGFTSTGGRGCSLMGGRRCQMMRLIPWGACVHEWNGAWGMGNTLPGSCSCCFSSFADFGLREPGLLVGGGCGC